MKRLLALVLGATLFVPSAGAAAYDAVAVAPAAAAAPARMDEEVFYQIFTRSMRDSNGDRQGDLKGIEQSLPYLQRLGVTSILLTPYEVDKSNYEKLLIESGYIKAEALK